MATVLPAKDDWAEVFRNIGKGAGEGYINRSDEMALQKAVGNLHHNATPREILDAITNTKTYRPGAKQEALKNYMGVAEFEESRRKNKRSEEIEEGKAGIAAAKQEAQKRESALIVQNSNLPAAQKKNFAEAAERGELTPASARAVATHPGDATEYEVAKNNAKRFEKPVESYQAKAVESEQAIPLLETAIVNNESYGPVEKKWDTLLDTVNSPFLNQFKSKTGQELEAIVPVSVASFGAKMSGQLTNQKINLITKKAIGLGKDKDANRMMLYLDYFDRTLDQLRSRFSNEIISENKYGLPPADFDKQLRERLKPYQKMISSDIDRLISNKQPTSAISKLAITNQAEQQLQPGEVLVISPEGQIGALPEEALNDPEYKNYKRFQR